MTKQTIEHRTEKIARAICLRLGQAEGLWELHLSTAFLDMGLEIQPNSALHRCIRNAYDRLEDRP